MATTTKAKMTFYDAEGLERTYTYSHVKSNAAPADVKALMQAMITNTSILLRTLASIKEAELVTTTTTTLTLPA